MKNLLRFLALTVILGVCAPQALAWQAQATEKEAAEAANTSQGEVLTQGPIHEAFAQPLLFDPKPSPIVPKAAPEPINELPPDQKPEGENVQWIPGYWSWDDARNDFVWVSGVWRAVPQGREWVPGYWNTVDGGSQWVPGYWGATDMTQVQYLPEPPVSLEKGPSSPAPAPDATWSPGAWTWQGDQYQWRPGFWVNAQPNWVWVPASTSWTPNGYVSNPGFWDYPLASRGQPFAPVYFGQGVTPGSNLAYTPSIGLLTSALATSLFVRPAYHSYVFGDYYAANNTNAGIYPWYAFHNSRNGYDPLYAYAASQNLPRNPRWANEIQDVYRYRREHADARPPRTFAESRNLVARPSGTNSAAINAAASLALARPLSQLATPATGAAPNALRFEKLDPARRKQFSARTSELRKFGAERTRREGEARRNLTTAARADHPAARPMEVPRSPIVARPAKAGQGAPPAAPAHPEVDRNARPPASAAAPIRQNPRVQTRPPAAGAPKPAPAPRTAPMPKAAPAPEPAPAPKPAPPAKEQRKRK